MASNNINKAYDEEMIREFAERLLGDESIFSDFYAPTEIENLINEWKIK